MARSTSRSRRSRSGSRSRSSPSASPKCKTYMRNGSSNANDAAATPKRVVTPGNIIEEGFFDVIYEPHTITALAVMIAWIAHAAIFPSGDDKIANIREGIYMTCFMFLYYCMVQLRDGVLIRPHPAVWRVVHGAGLLYFGFLVFLLSQTQSGVHTVLGVFDERVGKPHEPITYGEDCRVFVAHMPLKAVLMRIRTTLLSTFSTA